MLYFTTEGTYSVHPFVLERGDILDDQGCLTYSAELDKLPFHFAESREVNNKFAGGVTFFLFAGETALSTEPIATASRGEPFVTTFIILPVNDKHIGIAKITKVIRVVVYVVALFFTSGE